MALIDDVRTWLTPPSVMEASPSETAASALSECSRLLDTWLNARIAGVDLTAGQRTALQTAYQAAKARLTAALTKLP